MRKNNVIKTVIAAAIMVAALGTLTGCSVEKNYSKTVTHTVTDADGNTTTTTTTNNNGVVTKETTTYTADEAMASMVEDMNYDADTIEDEAEDEEAPVIEATLSIENTTGATFAEFYIADSDDTDWGRNVLGDDTLEDEEIITFGSKFRYSEDYRYWDVEAVDAEGNALPFDHLDMFEAEDLENITIAISYDAENDIYTATVR